MRNNDIVINIGNIAKARKNFDDPQEGRVYCIKGVVPTIRCGGKYLVLLCVKTK